jgi:hypothetical protein
MLHNKKLGWIRELLGVKQRDKGQGVENADVANMVRPWTNLGVNWNMRLWN